MALFYEFLQWCSAIGEIFMCYCFLSAVIDNKILKRNKIYIGTCSLIIGSLLAINRGKDMNLLSWTMLLFQSVLIFLSLIKKAGNKKKLCFCVTMAYNICLAFFQLLFSFGMLIVFHTKSIRMIYFNNGIYKSSCYLLSLLAVFVSYILFFNHHRNCDFALKPYTWIIFLYDTAGICMVIWLQAQLLLYGRHRGRESLFFILIILGATFSMLLGSIKSAEKRTELEMLGLKNRLLEDNYKEIQNMYQNYACTFHDMKNHLIILENYCRAGETEKAVHYIEKIQEPIQNFKYYFKSGNEVLDIILNYKLSEAERKGIRIQADIEAADEMVLEGCDLCAILSNLLDNATEACDLIDYGEKWIHVLVKRMGDISLINVSNSYSAKGKKESGQASKKRMHGYGLKSVEAKVKKYNGELMWGSESGRFVVTITFYKN